MKRTTWRINLAIRITYTLISILLIAGCRNNPCEGLSKEVYKDYYHLDSISLTRQPYAKVDSLKFVSNYNDTLQFIKVVDSIIQESKSEWGGWIDCPQKSITQCDAAIIKYQDAGNPNNTITFTLEPEHYLYNLSITESNLTLYFLACKAIMNYPAALNEDYNSDSITYNGSVVYGQYLIGSPPVLFSPKYGILKVQIDSVVWRLY